MAECVALVAAVAGAVVGLVLAAASMVRASRNTDAWESEVHRSWRRHHGE